MEVSHEELKSAGDIDQAQQGETFRFEKPSFSMEWTKLWTKRLAAALEWRYLLKGALISSPPMKFLSIRGFPCSPCHDLGYRSFSFQLTT